METKHDKDQYWNKQRAHFRREFLKRSRKVQEWKQKIDKESEDYYAQGYDSHKRLEQVAKEICPYDPAKGMSILRRHYLFKKVEPYLFGTEPDMEEILALESMSPIEIVFDDGTKIIKTKYYDYFERALFDGQEVYERSLQDWKMIRNHWPILHAEQEMLGITSDEPLLAIDGVNKKEGTIMLRIHIDRQKGDIVRDIMCLLTLLKRESELIDNIKLGSSKKPQWDVYDKYLQVYDMKRANPKMQWSEIAKIVFPEEVTRERKPTHRKIRRKELVTNSAVSKVFRYWKEANKMVNKEGWKQI